MTAFLSGRLRQMKPYVPGEQPRDQAYIKLNTNESPYPPSEGVLKAVEEEAGKMNLYSDPELLVARRKLAARYGVGEENVLLSNGSDEALKLVPPTTLSLEQSMEFLADDELLEVTPKSIRLRKTILNKELRLKAESRARK